MDGQAAEQRLLGARCNESKIYCSLGGRPVTARHGAAGLNAPAPVRIDIPGLPAYNKLKAPI